MYYFKTVLIPTGTTKPNKHGFESCTDLPINIAEDCAVRHGVEEGPEGAVAAAVVVGVEEVLLHRHGDRLAGEKAGGGGLVA